MQLNEVIDIDCMSLLTCATAFICVAITIIGIVATGIGLINAVSITTSKLI